MTKTQTEAHEVFTGTFMQRIIDNQRILKLIWEDAMATSPQRQMMIVRKRNESTDVVEIVEQSVLRRGYKIQYTEKTGLYELLRTNTSDYYKHVNNTEMLQFAEEGWLRTCDTKQVERDRKRLAKFNKKIDNANEQRNDSLITHWRRRRMELIENISSIEEKLNR